MKKLFPLLIIMLFSFSVFGQKNLDKKLKTLDAYFEQALSDWNVPGMAVAIIKDGEIVFSKGYGTRNVDNNEPVDANTLFAIASNTKSFTAASLAMMVDEGLLNWGDPVRDYLPWFELYDPFVSASFTIRDLLTHRSGLATFSGDLLWYGTNLLAKRWFGGQNTSSRYTDSGSTTDITTSCTLPQAWLSKRFRE